MPEQCSVIARNTLNEFHPHLVMHHPVITGQNWVNRVIINTTTALLHECCPDEDDCLVVIETNYGNTGIPVASVTDCGSGLEMKMFHRPTAGTT